MDILRVANLRIDHCLIHYHKTPAINDYCDNSKSCFSSITLPQYLADQGYVNHMLGLCQNIVEMIMCHKLNLDFICLANVSKKMFLLFREMAPWPL